MVDFHKEDYKHLFFTVFNNLQYLPLKVKKRAPHFEFFTLFGQNNLPEIISQASEVFKTSFLIETISVSLEIRMVWFSGVE